MSQLQLVASFVGFEDGQQQDRHDFRIETAENGGSVETLTHGKNVTSNVLPSGLGPELTMDQKQAFTALRHMQDLTKALSEAFGADIEPQSEGIQIQGVAAMVRPSWVEALACRSLCGKDAVERMAFLYRDGYLMVSTLGDDGEWHSDAEKLEEALEGFTFTDLAAIVCKILGIVKLSWWQWGLAIACSVVTSGVAAIACIAGLIALQWIRVAMVIAVIEEVTGESCVIASRDDVRQHLQEGQLASARSSLESALSDTKARLGREFPHDALGLWLTDRV